MGFNRQKSKRLTFNHQPSKRPPPPPIETLFHQSEDKRTLNFHKLRFSYVKSILITNITFPMLLLKLSTLNVAIFLFFSLVLSLLCVYYIRMLFRHVFFGSNNVVADEYDHVVLDKVALCIDTLCMQQKCDESALCVQQIGVAKGKKNSGLVT